MTNEKMISAAFEAFGNEAPEHAAVWMRLTRDLAAASSLDAKTHHLAFLAVLAALRRPNGVPFHVRAALQAGATREEIISAILVALPPAGHVVTEALPPAIAALKAVESSVDEVRPSEGQQSRDIGMNQQDEAIARRSE